MTKEYKQMWHRWLVLPLNIIFMELIIRIVAGVRFFDVELIAVLLNSIAFGGIITALCSFYSSKVGSRLLLGVQIGLSVWYCVQIVYHSFFGKFLIFYSIFAGGTNQIIASGLVQNTLGAIADCWWAFFVMAAPAVGMGLYLKKYPLPQLGVKGSLWRAMLGIVTYLLIIALGCCIPSLREVQQDAYNKERSVKSFGLLRAELMDIRCNILGLGGTGELEIVEVGAQPSSEQEEEPQYADNVMNIDFEALAAAETDEVIRGLHEYFANERPSAQNEYTGMFEGYNLIQITAEGFSHYAIDEYITPTLYKMQTEGFNFTNFYTPIWEVSTFDGEYCATTGLIPKSGVWSYYQAGEEQVLLPFTMPQQFLNDGLETVRAYHNHTYSYYHRDVSHPNLGFIYEGLGNGLEDVVNGNRWPESDVEMIEGTVADYLTGQRFMTYYMTVSGHLEYGFNDNSIAYKNQAAVTDLPYSDTVRAYYACNIELDRAMEKLLTALQEAGMADNTVIVITPDHYPYGLEQREQENPYLYFDELAGHSIDTAFELYKSCLIVYSPSMERGITIDKLCSSVDIIPTLNNLFGFEYDSRLLIGRDILSDSDPLVIFLNRSWITEKGSYNAETEEFTLFEGQTVEDEEAYIETVKTVVSNKFKVSAQILDNDYYSLVVDREHHYSE